MAAWSIEGPLFTAGKVNLNGWGIPPDEAPELASSLEGKPIRYCPAGKALPGIPPEHYCDAMNSSKNIIGSIDKVWASGKDEKGRQVYMQRATITDASTVQGIQSGKIPASWSLWGHAKNMSDDSMMHGVQGEATTLVDQPAYTEARFQWQAVAASFFTLNKRGLEHGANNIGDPSMGNEVPNSTQAPPATVPAGGAPQTQGTASFTTGVPPVTNNIYTGTPTGWTAGTGTVTTELNAIPAAPKPETYTKEDLDKAVEDARKATADELQRKMYASDIAKLQVAAGLIKAEDELKEVEKLTPLPASVLTDMKEKFTAITEKLQVPNEEGLGSGNIPAGASAGDKSKMIPIGAGKMIPMPAGLDDMMDRFEYDGKPLTLEDLQSTLPADHTIRPTHGGPEHG